MNPRVFSEKKGPCTLITKVFYVLMKLILEVKTCMIDKHNNPMVLRFKYVSPIFRDMSWGENDRTKGQSNRDMVRLYIL